MDAAPPSRGEHPPPAPGRVRRRGFILVGVLSAALAFGFILSRLIEVHLLKPRLEERQRLHAQAVEVFSCVPKLEETIAHLGETGGLVSPHTGINVYDGGISAYMNASVKGTLSDAQVQSSASVEDGYWRITNVTLTLATPPLGPSRQDMGYWGLPNAYLNFAPKIPAPPPESWRCEGVQRPLSPVFAGR